MSNSLSPNGLQHTRLPCPSLSPRVCSDSCSVSMMPSNHLIHCHPLLLPSIFPSIRGFSSELALRIRWPKDWSFNISLSNEYSGLISFRTDWFNLLTLKETLKSLLQYHSWKASVLRCSAFLLVQLSLYMTPGKTIALTRWTFVSSLANLLDPFQNNIFNCIMQNTWGYRETHCTEMQLLQYTNCDVVI